MESSLSAITSIASIQNLQNLFVTLLQYLLSPAIAVAIMWFLIQKTYNLGGLNERFKGALENIKDLKKDSKKLISHVDIIKTYLSSKFGMDAQLFASGSPLVLKSRGIELLKASGFDRIYQKDKLWFVDQIKNFKVKSRADIDDASNKLMDQIRDDPRFSNFREVAFQNGISVDLLFRVCAIYLRDQVAKELLHENRHGG